MNIARNPNTVAPPFGKYSHSVETPPAARTLYVAGQVGVKPDGKMAEGVDAQCQWAWKNLIAVLKDSGMGIEDVVKINIYLTNPDHVAPFRAARDLFIGDSRPAATLAVISRLAGPDWLIEIEAVAARA